MMIIWKIPYIFPTCLLEHCQKKQRLLWQKALRWEKAPCAQEREESCRRRWQQQINTYLSMWEIYTVLHRKISGMQIQLKPRSAREPSLEWAYIFPERR